MIRHRPVPFLQASLAAALIGCAAGQVASTPLAQSGLRRGITIADSLIDAGVGTLTPGAVLLVARNGKVIHERAFGYAELNDYAMHRIAPPRPMQTNTIFDLASVTKVMATTFATMMLVDRGQVVLDAPVYRYLPDFRGPHLDSITVRHLLQHSSGLVQWQPLYYQASNSAQTYAAIRDMPLGWGVGEGRHYSDLGFMILGYIVEKVSGQPLDQLVDQKLYKPLALAKTTFNPKKRSLTGFAGHAGLFSTAADAPKSEAAMPHFEAVDFSSGRWLKGNTHTHTLESDGDSPPELVAMWYKSRGYNFLVLSDHNVWVNPAKLSYLMDSSFLLIPGEELTTRFGLKPVHVNGLNIPHVIEPRTDSTLLGTVQKNVDAVREVEGVPHINHPNFGWAISQDVLSRVKNDKLIEIHNGHPLVHNEGGGDSPGMEAVWDYLLSAGKRIYGIAVDDAHHFQGEFAPDRANPGRGWVSVRASRLDGREIMTQMEAGRFYASSGVELDSVSVTPQDMTIHIRRRGDFKFTTEFIGQGGVVLKKTGDNPATYHLTGSETYVRPRITDSGGAVAWMQPVFIVH
ncbi:MAG: serine hydrolase [Gemmatimonadaceae bacterium]|nr:serine hydrolase [Gemmatimonadaceae bacterium]